jgi:Uma2 family endonuclease
MNVAATTAAEGFPRRAFTVEDIGRMIEAGIIHEDEKFELVEGEIVMMASKGIAHERIKSALTIAVVRALPDHLTMGVEVTLRLTNTIMLEPDIAVFPKELFKKSSAGFAQLDPGEAYLVIEVAVSSLAYDKGLKARLYARHRVREFWGHRRQRGHHVGSHRPKRRRMVVGRQMRAARHAHHSGAAWLLHQTRRDRPRNIAGAGHQHGRTIAGQGVAA